MMHNFKLKANAKKYAAKMRKKGYLCNVLKKKSGYGVSVRRK